MTGFAGVLRGTKNPFKMWDLRDGRELALERPRDPKLKGFGAAVVVPWSGLSIGGKGRAGSPGFRYRVACGLGLGNAHIWEFAVLPATAAGGDVPVRQTYLGMVNARTNSIAAMRFVNGGRTLLTMAYDAVAAQSWDLVALRAKARANAVANTTATAEAEVLVAGTPQAGGEDEETLAEVTGPDSAAETPAVPFKGGAREAKLLRQGPYEGAMALREYRRFFVASGRDRDRQSIENVVRHARWRAVFPARLLDDEAYDGETDTSGRPDGYGVRAGFDHGQHTYQGNWRAGLRHGLGTLYSSRSDAIVYTGEWADGVRCGHGEAASDRDVYNGFWKHDKRHGFGAFAGEQYE